jgi:hypothetical protein
MKIECGSYAKQDIAGEFSPQCLRHEFLLFGSTDPDPEKMGTHCLNLSRQVPPILFFQGPERRCVRSGDLYAGESRPQTLLKLLGDSWFAPEKEMAKWPVLRPLTDSQHEIRTVHTANISKTLQSADPGQRHTIRIA